jgi:exodeoxyribonuclease III
MKILSYNINGLRAAVAKGFNEWLVQTNADVVCLQEIKVNEQQFDFSVYEKLGYSYFCMPAKKLGYSGVAIFSKIIPERVHFGCGMAKYDDEGRFIKIDFAELSIINTYFPSGASSESRQQFKMEWLADFEGYMADSVKKSKVVICGDMNICHHPIDIHNPTANKHSPGFLPEEREWLTRFLKAGFVDSFRHFNKEAHQYTWWSYRAGARSKNLGWRIDYQLVSQSLLPKLKRSALLTQAYHSDHCPVLIEIDQLF